MSSHSGIIDLLAGTYSKTAVRKLRFNSFKCQQYCSVSHLPLITKNDQLQYSPNNFNTQSREKSSEN